MKKIIFLFIIVFVNFTNVFASTITQTFEDVFITYEDDNGEKITTAINVIKLDGEYVYKLYLGDVTYFNYDVYDESIIKSSVETKLDEVVYFQNILNTDDDTSWYYIAQFLIFDYIYSDDLYFSDSEGTEIEFLTDELKTFYTTMAYRYYNGSTIQIYNNEVIEVQGTVTSKTSYLSYTKVDDGYQVEVYSGTSGYLYVANYFNEGEDSVYYINSDNNVLYAGGGQFAQTDTIKIELATTSSVASSNPTTGINPFIPLFIGIPVIILGGIIVFIVKENKEKNAKKANNN